ncbi:di-heme-cytochrome C peroxidase [Sabulicella glaciei]|nr:di-heme-cytochrome C peroxidase [Roseococcus sp. MDT2-1-1]
MGKRISLAAAAALVLTGLGCASYLPEREMPDSVVPAAGQNWTDEQRSWFHHTSQGTKLMPYAWFLALEQPFLSWPSAAPPFASPAYMARFGFLPSPRSAINPDGLPVGFARDEFGVQEGSEEPEVVVGLTCAACHTGQIEYGRRAVRIEGGPSMADVGAFQDQIGVALFLTYGSEPRFARFAQSVLARNGQPNTEETRAALHRRLGLALDRGRTEAGLADRRRLYPVTEGFGRLDALGRGANFVFATLPNMPNNLAVADAPVSYPGLWDAPWFDWVQYNGAIRQPMGRNVAEAMGVRAIVKPTGGPAEPIHRSSVRVQNIYDMETMLAGPAPGLGLRAPAWPEDLLGPIDRAAAERGRVQFAQLCAGCHQPWDPAAQGAGIPRITMVPLDRIGTDPRAAMNFVNRTATLPNGRRVSAAQGLQEATTDVINAFYDANNVPERGSWVDAAGNVRPGRLEMNGNRPNEWRAPAAYRARPLNGIWATAPYLHNGAVPNLYQMLLPAERRDAVFHVGSRQFDPRNVGFVAAESRGTFRFDTSLPGNSNRGHEFRNGPLGNGTIGPELSDQQRRDIVEYLKTL